MQQMDPANRWNAMRVCALAATGVKAVGHCTFAADDGHVCVCLCIILNRSFEAASCSLKRVEKCAEERTTACTPHAPYVRDPICIYVVVAAVSSSSDVMMTTAGAQV
jgi:hypothetical protein